MKKRQVGKIQFFLDLSQPIYEQVLDQMRSAIAKGDISLGEKVPSVREMAQALQVNPNTVMRAYQELDRDGLTEMRRGQGTFVTTSPERIESFRYQLAKQAVDHFLNVMNRLGFTWEDIEQFMQQRYVSFRKRGDTND